MKVFVLSARSQFPLNEFTERVLSWQPLGDVVWMSTASERVNIRGFIVLAAGGVGYLDAHLLNEFAERVIYRGDWSGSVVCPEFPLNKFAGRVLIVS